jgi:hypothetical protein
MGMESKKTVYSEIFLRNLSKRTADIKITDNVDMEGKKHIKLWWSKYLHWIDTCQMEKLPHSEIQIRSQKLIDGHSRKLKSFKVMKVCIT